MCMWIFDMFIVFINASLSFFLNHFNDIRGNPLSTMSIVNFSQFKHPLDNFYTVLKFYIVNFFLLFLILENPLLSRDVWNATLYFHWALLCINLFFYALICLPFIVVDDLNWGSPSRKPLVLATLLTNLTLLLNWDTPFIIYYWKILF